MAKLIDADLLWQEVRDNPDITGRAYQAVKEHILGEKTVDAVEVVRCKDCRWRKQGKLCFMISGCGMPVGTGEDFFCSFGERR